MVSVKKSSSHRNDTPLLAILSPQGASDSVLDICIPAMTLPLGAS